MRRLTLMLTLTALAVVSAASARTDQPTSSAAVSEQRSVALRTTDRLLPTSHLAGFVYCKTRVKKVTAESAITGADLWWYRQRLAWCWNQTPGKVARITSATPRCAGTTYGITTWGYWWEFVGHVDCRWSGGVGSGGVTRYRQGHFRYCPQPTGCVQNKPLGLGEGVRRRHKPGWRRGHLGDASAHDRDRRPRHARPRRDRVRLGGLTVRQAAQP